MMDKENKPNMSKLKHGIPVSLIGDLWPPQIYPGRLLQQCTGLSMKKKKSPFVVLLYSKNELHLVLYKLLLCLKYQC